MEKHILLRVIKNKQGSPIAEVP